MAKPRPERPVGAVNQSRKQWLGDEEVRQSAHALCELGEVHGAAFAR